MPVSKVVVDLYLQHGIPEPGRAFCIAGDRFCLDDRASRTTWHCFRRFNACTFALPPVVNHRYFFNRRRRNARRHCINRDCLDSIVSLVRPVRIPEDDRCYGDYQQAGSNNCFRDSLL